MTRKSKQIEAVEPTNAAPLTISPEKVCFLIMKAREFDAKDAVTDFLEEGLSMHGQSCEEFEIERL